MISEYELANIITGATRAEGGVARKSSATILGKAVEDSENGMVRVVPEGDVFAPDGDNTIIIPTSPSVRAGDTVQIGLVGGVSKRPMVVAAGGEGDRQDSAITSAANAAQVAWNYADSAHTAANQAKTAAQNAEADAARAEEAAQQAVEDAATAKEAAEQAVEDAGTAYQAAQDAQTSADNAATAASNAQTSANAAAEAAQAAQEDATDAKNAATQANTHANSALTQLSIIEDVAGTLDWISKHGTYTLTSDTTVQEGTVYFEKVGNDYIPIAEPEGNPHAQGWYTLDVTDSQSDYIMAHLAVTSAGLWVLPSGIGSAADEQHAAGYKTLLSSTGMTIYDDTGRAVATYGEGIVFDSSRELKIGNNNAYIEYYDSNNDEVADSLRIVGAAITLASGKTVDQEITDAVGANKSVRFKLLRDSWTDSQWATPETVGHTTAWSNYHIDSAGQHPATGYDISTLHVGDLIVVEGTSTDSKAPHSLLLKVNAVPSSTATTVNCTTVTSVTSKQLATRISQTETEITLQAKLIEESSNLLYDTDVSSVTKVNGPSNRYFSDTGNTMISTSFEPLSDPPKSGLKYAAQFVCDGTQTAAKARSLRFYNGTNNYIPLVAGQKYTATWWARCTAGSGKTRFSGTRNSSGNTYQTGSVSLDSTWRKFSATYTPESIGTYGYAYFTAVFDANTSGTVQLCGFKLVAGDSPENVSAELSVQADKISMVVDDSTTSSSLVLTSQAMDYIGDHVEIKGTDGTTTVISGGQIQTGSLTIGAMSSSTQNDILNSNIEVGGTNLVMGSGDYNGWIFTNAAVTKSGNILDINVSGQTSNTFYRGRGWLSTSFATLKEIAPTIIVSVEVMSDDWSAVTSDSAAGFASASVQLCTVMGTIGSQTAGETKRYRYMGLNQTDKWQSIPAMENGKWLKFVSVPISVPDMFNADVSKGDGTNVLADLMLRRNGHVKWRNLKVEAGNKATAWSPAPEDYNSAIAAAQTTANTANNRSVAYRGTNNTASTTAAKTVTCANFALAIGATISVYNQGSNSVAGALTLNVNNTGAKTVYIGADATSATNQLLWHIGSTITYTYDGTYWKVADAPSNYYGTSCSTAAGTAQKQTTISAGVIFKGVQLEVPMQYANTAATPTLAVQNTTSTASNLVNGILYGTGTTKPTQANGYSWLANMSVIFRFDGQYWRTGNQTIIDGGHILTGTISADRIAASSIAVGKLTVEAQSAMLNSNIEVGGRNYILDSAGVNASGLGSAAGSRKEYQSLNVGQSYMDVESGTQVTVSFDLYMTVNTANPTLNVYNTNNGGPKQLSASPTASSSLVLSFTAATGTTISQRVSVTGYIVDRSSPTLSDNFIEFYSVYGTSNWFSVSNIKLERGNKATDWSPAPEDMASAADSIEYIVGTQSAATGSWTGVTKETALVAGKTIAYRLPYAGSGNATLNLTLAGGGTTGAKAVYSMTTRVTTQYPANSIIQMTYDGSNWRTTGWYNTDTNARYVQFYNTIVAKSAIRAASIIGGDSSGYEEATAGAVFDLSYPIMWTTAAIAADATDYSHIYTLCYDRTLATCYSSFTGTKNQIVYLVGTASGNKFTVDSSIITSTEPTEEDGKIYIPIGRLGNDTNGKTKFNFSTSLPVTPYAYLGGSFQRVDLSTSVRVSDVEGGLEMAVSNIATVTDTAKAASDGVSSLNTRVNAQEETLTQVKTTFTFSTTGLTIGKSGSTMQSTFGNTSLQFKSGNTVVLELDAEKSTARADRFAIGKYQLKSVDNGNAIAFVYVGG